MKLECSSYRLSADHFRDRRARTIENKDGPLNDPDIAPLLQAPALGRRNRSPVKACQLPSERGLSGSNQSSEQKTRMTESSPYYQLVICAASIVKCEMRSFSLAAKHQAASIEADIQQSHIQASVMQCCMTTIELKLQNPTPDANDRNILQR
jgi:hypothetical protein